MNQHRDNSQRPSQSQRTVSPIKTCAGWQLNHRNPKPAPINGRAENRQFPGAADVRDLQIGGGAGVAGHIRQYQENEGDDHGAANGQPIQTSVRLTALELPTIVNVVKISPMMVPLVPCATGNLLKGTITSLIKWLVAGAIQR